MRRHSQAGRTPNVQGATGDLAGHRRETLQEFIKGIIVFQVLEQRLHGHAGSLEYGCAAEDIRVHRNQVARVHVRNLACLRPGCKPRRFGPSAAHS